MKWEAKDGSRWSEMPERERKAKNKEENTSEKNARYGIERK